MSFATRCHDRWANTHPLWRFLAVAVLLGVLTLVLGNPVRSVYRGWQIDRQFAAATEASANDRHAEAREFALQLLRSAPHRHEVLPILLRATDSLGDPLRAEVAARVLEPAYRFPPDLRLAAWRMVCLHAPTWQVLTSWALMPAEEKSHGGFVAALFDRHYFDGSIATATELLEEQPHPLPPDLHLRLMTLLLDTGSAGARRTFQEDLIQRIAGGHEGIGMLLPLLDRLPQESLLPELHEALARWQSRHDAEVDAATALRLARCEIAAHPQRTGAIFAEGLDRYRTEAPVATALFCMRLDRPDIALELAASFPEDDAEGFELHCRLLEEAGDLAGWAEHLQSPPAGAFLPGVLSEQAYVASLMDQRGARVQAEEAALLAASDSTRDDGFIRLARQAESRQQIDLARRAWVEAVRKRGGPLPLGVRLAGVIEQLAMTNKEGELLDVLTAYRFMEPTNFVFTVQQAYLSCITGRNSPASVIRELEHVRQAEPDLLPARCVTALAHLMEDRPEEALELTEVDVNWSETMPAYRAIRAITLLRNGREDAAQELLALVAWDEMLPAEVRTLRGLLDQAMSGPE